MLIGSNECIVDGGGTPKVLLHREEGGKKAERPEGADRKVREGEGKR